MEVARVPGRVALDTSAYSQLRGGHEKVLQWVSEADVVFLSTIVLGELEAGFLSGSRYQQNATLLSEFLTEAFVQVLPVSPDTARRYGRIFAQLRSRGTPIPTNDLWIAAATLASGAHLLTFDHHFALVEGLPHTLL